MAISRYPIEQPEPASTSAKLLFVTYSKYENDWSSLPHSHHFTELCYIRKGRGRYLIGDTYYPVKEDDFIIINSNVLHTEVSEGDIPMEYIIIGVEGLDFIQKDDQGHFIFNCRNNRTDFLFYMNVLLDEMSSRRPNCEQLCRNLLEVLLIKLIRLTHLNFETVTYVKSNRECARVKQYIESNYMHDISLDTLAEISHLNKFYMAHAFTELFGFPPVDYLCEVRINASKMLLESTDLSITDISHSVGFSSNSYFSQCFRRRCGMTASAYRKECQNQK